MSELEKDLTENMPQEPTQQEQTQQEQKESDREQNLRILRERVEASERRAAELEYALRTHQQPQKQEQPEEEFSLEDDTYIEGKHLKKVYKKQQKDIAELKRQLEESTTRAASTTAEWRLKSEYPDFDSVVSSENIKKLAAAKPGLYRTLLSNKDLYDQGQTAYEMIKAMNVPVRNVPQDKKIEENRSKPRSASTAGGQVGDTPLAHISDFDRRALSEERKAQIRREIALNRQRGA